MILRAAHASVRRFPYFTLKYAPNGISKNRIGVVIGKTVDRRATRRNLLKRRIRGAARTLPPRGLDILFIVNRSARGADRVGWASALRDATSAIAETP